MTERWTVGFSSGKEEVFDDWDDFRKFMFGQETDMSDYPVTVTMCLMDGDKLCTQGETVGVVTFSAIYTKGLVEGRSLKA